jgi:hypothetical protein
MTAITCSGGAEIVMVLLARSAMAREASTPRTPHGGASGKQRASRGPTEEGRRRRRPAGRPPATAQQVPDPGRTRCARCRAPARNGVPHPWQPRRPGRWAREQACTARSGRSAWAGPRAVAPVAADTAPRARRCCGAPAPARGGDRAGRSTACTTERPPHRGRAPRAARAATVVCSHVADIGSRTPVLDRRSRVGSRGLSRSVEELTCRSSPPPQPSPSSRPRR